MSAAGGYAILNASTGKVTVEGGTLKATTGVAIYNSETGKVTVSGGAEITSANTSATTGTNSSCQGVDREPLVVLDIQNGTVENTANGYAVYFAATGVTAANLNTYYTKTGGTVGRVYPTAVELLGNDDAFKGSYVTLDEAIGAAATGDKLKVIADINLGETGVDINGIALTLDLNGHKITHSGSTAGNHGCNQSGKQYGYGAYRNGQQHRPDRQAGSRQNCH